MTPIPTQFDVPRNTFYSTFEFHVNLVTISGADVVSAFTPGFAGKIIKMYWVTNTVTTDINGAATFKPYIGSLLVSGGVVTIGHVAGDQATLGLVVNGTSVIGSNVFSNIDTLKIVASSVTAYDDGDGQLVLVLAMNVL